MASFSDIQVWLSTSKTAVDLFKGLLPLIPKSQDRDAAELQLKAAEEALARSDSALAKSLGFRLCSCTFPPQIMLWREKEQATVCPREECGRRILPRRIAPPVRPDWLDR